MFSAFKISWADFEKSVTYSGFSLWLIFSKSTGWISPMMISQDSSKFSKGDLEKCLGFSTLLGSPDKWIIRRIVEISGGIDVWKPLKTRFETVFSFC